MDLINLLYSLTKEKKIEYNSYAYATYSLLKVALEQPNDHQLYNAVSVAYQNSIQLVNALKKLYDNLGRYYRNITKLQEINGILEEHFLNYKEYIDKIYHPLKTTDPVDIYRIPIQKMVETVMGDPKLLEELLDQAMQNSQYENREDAKLDLMTKLGEIESIYETINKRVGEVEIKNNEYVRATMKKISYLLSNDKELKGKLIQLLKNSKNVKVLEEMQKQLNLNKQVYLDKESVFLRSSKSEKKQGKSMPVEKIVLQDEEELKEFISKIENSYTSKRIQNHMRQLFGDMPIITTKDIHLASDEEFILLLLGTIQEERSFYRIEYTNQYVIKDGYRIPEMKLIKKE